MIENPENINIFSRIKGLLKYEAGLPNLPGLVFTPSSDSFPKGYGSFF